MWFFYLASLGHDSRSQTFCQVNCSLACMRLDLVSCNSRSSESHGSFFHPSSFPYLSTLFSLLCSNYMTSSAWLFYRFQQKSLVVSLLVSTLQLLQFLSLFYFLNRGLLGYAVNCFAFIFSQTWEEQFRTSSNISIQQNALWFHGKSLVPLVGVLPVVASFHWRQSGKCWQSCLAY